MSVNLENSAVATGLEKVSFNSNLKEKQCQRMLKLPHNWTHVTCYQNDAQNSPSQTSTVMNHELPDVQAEFRKARGPREQIANIHLSFPGGSEIKASAVHGVAKSRTWLSNFTFTFHFHASEKEMATHSSVLGWRIPGTGKPDGLPSMGSHRVWHDWSDLAAVAANAGDSGLIPGSGRSPGEWNGNPLQYSCLENPMDKGAW